jgi:hypothetical protein
MRQWLRGGGISGCSRPTRTAGQGEAFDGVEAIVQILLAVSFLWEGELLLQLFDCTC